MEAASVCEAAWFALVAVACTPYKPLLLQIASAMTFYLIVDILVLNNPLVLQPVSNVCHWYTTLVRNSFGWGNVLGPNPLGFNYLLFTIFLVLPYRSRRSLLLPAISTQFICVLCGSILEDLGYADWLAYGLPLIGSIIIPFIYCVWPSSAQQEGGWLAAWISGFALLSLLLTMFSGAAFFNSLSGNGRSILFLNDNLGGEGSPQDITNFADCTTNTPFFKFQQMATDAVYGRLANRLLPALGYNVKIKAPSEVSPAELKNYDLVVAICLQHKVSESFRDALYQAVGSGTTNLFVCGDHTNILGVQEPFNYLLEPTAIRLDYDAVYPFGQWNGQIKLCMHPVNSDFWRAGNRYSPGWSVGASLQAPLMARPLLIASDGWGDVGTPNVPMYAGLGDRIYTSNETRGGLLLAVEEAYGKGTVMAFGDTAFLQDTMVDKYFDYQARLFSYMTTKPSHFSGLPFWMICLALGLCLCGRLMVQFSLRCSLTVLSGACVVMGIAHLSSTRNVYGLINTPLTVIDDVHTEQFEEHSLTNGVSNLSNFLSRYPGMTIVGDMSQAINSGNARLIVLVAPRRPLNEKELSSLLGFIRGGGSLLVSVGYFESTDQRELLDAIGCTLSSMPLGGGQQLTCEGKFPPPNICELWPMELSSEWQKRLTSFGHPVVVSRTFGKGTICVVSDSFALLDSVLGQPGQFDIASYLFWVRACDMLFRINDGISPPPILQFQFHEHDLGLPEQ